MERTNTLKLNASGTLYLHQCLVIHRLISEFHSQYEHYSLLVNFLFWKPQSIVRHPGQYVINLREAKSD